MPDDLTPEGGAPAAAPTPAPEPTLRESLEAAYDAGTDGTSAPASQTSRTAVPEGEERPTTGEKPATPTEPEPTAAPAPKPERPIPERLKGKWADKWATLDPALREEFHGYESHVGAMANKFGKDAKAWNELNTALAPYQALMQEEGADIKTSVVSLFETARLLRKGTPEQKVALLEQIRTAYNIPSNVPVDTTTGQPAGSPVGGVSVELANRLDRLEQTLLTRDAAETQNVRARVNQEVDGFLADAANVYLQEPGYLDTMTALISSGRAQNVKDAYDQAAWLHEGTRAMEIAKINAARLSSSAAEAERARNLGVSVNGNAPGPVRLDPSKLSLRDTLSAAYDGELQ